MTTKDNEVPTITDLPKRTLRDRIPSVPPKVKTAFAVAGAVATGAVIVSAVSKRKSLKAGIDVTLPDVDVTTDVS